MSINTEKEERAMLDELTYKKMVSDLCFNIIPLTQTNYYFDTKELTCLKNHIVVRLREINNSKYELTTKIKGKLADKEININITKNEFETMLKNREIIHHDLGNGELVDLEYIVDLSTKRYVIKYENYLLVIDENHYDNIVDFNIEIESDISKEHAEKILFEYKEKFGFEYTPNYMSKSRRAINAYLNKVS